MTEQDKDYLESLYAGFAMIGFLMNGDCSLEEIPGKSKALAKAMMEPETTIGLPPIRRKAKAK
tara:strand:- start:1763 stop:1951 length:189 start_codon:yes stop_codon:yes gene_type:complete